MGPRRRRSADYGVGIPVNSKGLDLTAPARWRRPRTATLLGPAMVAYVDPGNVATNVAAGARHGYLLVWVLVLATLAAALLQYLSAALGAVTGASLPGLLGERLSGDGRWVFWGQAEVVAMATRRGRGRRRCGGAGPAGRAAAAGRGRC